MAGTQTQPRRVIGSPVVSLAARTVRVVAAAGAGQSLTIGYVERNGRTEQRVTLQRTGAAPVAFGRIVGAGSKTSDQYLTAKHQAGRVEARGQVRQFNAGCADGGRR